MELLRKEEAGCIGVAGDGNNCKVVKGIELVENGYGKIPATYWTAECCFYF